MKKYPSQALAVVLALLIVGSILGFVLYASMIRESERVVEQKSSAEANELAETMVGLISTAGYEKVNNEEVLTLLDCDLASLSLPGSVGCSRDNMSLEDLEDVFFEMGLEELDLSGFSQELVDDFCVGEISMRSLSDEGVLIEQDEVYSIFLNKINWESCEINFEMSSEEFGSSAAEGFVMSTFYALYDSEELVAYKPYEFEDILGFSYSVGGENMINYTDSLNFPSSYPGVKTFEGQDYSLDEVRFKSLGGSSHLSWNVVGNCNAGNHLLVELGATCGGNYIGKSFVLPEAYFSPPMFDYVYFQGYGDLTSDE